MTGIERDATDTDLFGDHGGGDDRAIFSEYGTIGYANQDSLTVLGEDGSPDDGVTLVRVTTYRGKAPTERAKPGIAQGHQILCHLLGPLFYVPPRGTRVLVVYPGGDTTQPGVIMGTVGASPFTQFKEDRAVLDVGPGEDFVIKGRSILLMDHVGDAPSTFGAWLGVGPIAGSNPGVYANDGFGAGFQVTGGVFGAIGTDGGSSPEAKSLMQLSASDATLSYAGGGYLTITAAKADLMHNSHGNIVAATVGLGPLPTVPVSSVGAPGLPSTCVLITM